MISLSEITTHESEWLPDSVQITLNARLDARLVPHGSGLRLDYSHVVVLDNFIGEPERKSLLEVLTQPDWDHSQGPPPSSWERETADGAGLPKTWGLKDSILQELAKGNLPAMQEVHTRLAKLYPDYLIAHMPSDLIQHRQAASADSQEPGEAQLEHDSPLPFPTYLRQPIDDDGSHLQTGGGICSHPETTGGHASNPASPISCHVDQDPAAQPADHPAASEAAIGDQVPEHASSTADCQTPPVDCNQFVGNAAVYGDCYTWHVDADPAAFPPSPWVDAFGYYCNGEPGRPLLVSLLLYLDDKWPRQWDAETLFLDDDTDIGVVVRPKRFWAVLMDQDVLHRVSTPSQVAGLRPRYSLVWKLVFIPRAAGQQCCIAKSSWGAPTAIGSAAKVESIKRSLLQKSRGSC